MSCGCGKTKKGGNARQICVGQLPPFILPLRAFQVGEGPCKALGVALGKFALPDAAKRRSSWHSAPHKYPSTPTPNSSRSSDITDKQASSTVRSTSSISFFYANIMKVK
ncbi:hypothetical protein B5807_04338 [Epicoccum nigrum]|uniref:Uncharacterized protein n=1 Tax=Epicoccum nigrum TaxID=105696 RepID=A0A1Y2M6W9_EPING|nr:hypothetical protein B5807_04338 [Epicoccum nigrum]